MKPQHRLIILVVWMTGVRLSEDMRVFQTPRDIFRRADDDDVILSFTHTLANHDTIQWYRRVPGGTRSLKLLALVNYEKALVEPPFRGRVDVSGDGRGAAHLRIIRPDDGGHFLAAASTGGSYDEAFFGAGTKLTVLDPNVKITPPTVKLLPPSDGECTNQKDKEAKKKTLVCAATDFYPDHVGVAWMVDSQKRDKGVATDSEALRRGLGYSITSRLRVPASEWLHGSTNFTCVLTFFDGTTYSDYAESISGKDDSAGGGFTRESFLRLTQSAKLSYAVLIAKSCVYAAFVAFLLWRFRASPGKNN